MSCRKLWLCLSIFILLNHQVEAGDETDTDTITLEQAVSLAVCNNPELNVLSSELTKAKARTLQAGLRTNPEISLGIENFGGSGEFKGFESAEKSLLLSQEIQLGKKRQKRERVARLEENIIDWDIKQLESDIIMQTTQSFYDVLGANELLNLEIELTRLAERVYKIVQDRVSAGKVSPLEEIRAKVNLENQKIELKTTEKELKLRIKELNALLVSTLIKAVDGSLEILEPLMDLKEITGLISKNPDIARFKAEEEHRMAALKLEMSQSSPDVTVAGGLKNISGDYAAVVEFSMPIKGTDRNQGNINEAEENLQQVNKEQKAVEISVSKRLTSSYEEAEALSGQLLSLKSNILPAMENVFDSIQEGYRAGKFTYLEVIDAQQTFFESKKQYLEALLSYHRVCAEIERLTGRKVRK